MNEHLLRLADCCLYCQRLLAAGIGRWECLKIEALLIDPRRTVCPSFQRVMDEYITMRDVRINTQSFRSHSYTCHFCEQSDPTPYFIGNHPICRKCASEMIAKEAY